MMIRSRGKRCCLNEIASCEMTAYNLLTYKIKYVIMEYYYEPLFEEDFQGCFEITISYIVLRW